MKWFTLHAIRMGKLYIVSILFNIRLFSLLIILIKTLKWAYNSLKTYYFIWYERQKWCILILVAQHRINIFRSVYSMKVSFKLFSIDFLLNGPMGLKCNVLRFLLKNVSVESVQICIISLVRLNENRRRQSAFIYTIKICLCLRLVLWIMYEWTQRRFMLSVRKNEKIHDNTWISLFMFHELNFVGGCNDSVASFSFPNIKHAIDKSFIKQSNL